MFHVQLKSGRSQFSALRRPRSAMSPALSYSVILYPAWGFNEEHYRIFDDAILLQSKESGGAIHECGNL